MASTSPLFLFPVLPNPLEALPAVINHLLAAEPWARDQLRPHAGKTLQFTMAPFELRLTVAADGMSALAAKDAQPAVQIALPLSVLPQVISQGPQAAMRQVKLEGDAEFAQAVSTVAQNLRWEAEEDLSKFVGDVAARRITTGAREVAVQVQKANAKLAGNVAEYLLEENPQLVRPRDVEAFSDAVRVLRDDLARLEKRIARLAGN